MAGRDLRKINLEPAAAAAADKAVEILEAEVMGTGRIAAATTTAICRLALDGSNAMILTFVYMIPAEYADQLFHALRDAEDSVLGHANLIDGKIQRRN